MKLFSDDLKIEDAQLDTAGQRAIASAVKALDEDTLSLAWRSSLSAKIAAAEQKKQRRTVSLRWLSFGSIASVGAAAVFISMNMVGVSKVTPQSASSSTFAYDLEKVHDESLIVASVSGAPLGTQESSPFGDEYAYPDSLL
ncbi:MAG TPA: hypothetical protein VK171_04580 [Fimbriimonas sp.]|nr:hypothetical protein [Fimbriimonas sp.]